MKNPYGLKEDGELVTVDSVERGLACGCTCPKCGRRLEARKGDEREHYFAHDDGPDCGAAYQTALQMLAKEVLEEGKLLLPPLAIYPSDNHPLRGKVYREVVGEDVSMAADEVSLEFRTGRKIPDVVFRVKQRVLLIEILVTHRVNVETLAKIISLDIGAIQVDFSKMGRVVTKEDLRQVLVLGDEMGQAEWLFHPRQQSALDKLDRDLAANSAAVLKETQELNRKKRAKQYARELAESQRQEEKERKRKFLF